MAENWYLAWPDHIEEVDDPVTTFHLPEAEGRAESMRRINARGPFPSYDMAVDAQCRDDVARYWEWNMAVYAVHCPGCGRFAQMLAGCLEGGGWYWQVSDCKQCGIIDSRTHEA